MTKLKKKISNVSKGKFSGKAEGNRKALTRQTNEQNRIFYGSPQEKKPTIGTKKCQKANYNRGPSQKDNFD